MFAEDVGLLPDGTIASIVRNRKGKAEVFGRMVIQVFEAEFDKTAQNEIWLPRLDALRNFLSVSSPDLMGLFAAYNDLSHE